METIAASINDTAKALGLGRTKIYELIAQKKLETIKIGRRRLVKAESIRKLIDGDA
jgi:excisionase family DNA binding protein